jgi:hypothetical protein
MKKWINQLSLFLLTLTFSVSCSELANQKDEKSAGRMKLQNSDLLITTNSFQPQFNILNYFQSEKPHTQIEKIFSFPNQSTTSSYRLDKANIEAEGCDGNLPSFLLYAIKGSEIVDANSKKIFTASGSTQLQIVVSNSGSCQKVAVRFSILKVD